MHAEVHDQILEVSITKPALAAVVAVVALGALALVLAGSMMALGMWLVAAFAAAVTLSALRFS